MSEVLKSPKSDKADLPAQSKKDEIAHWEKCLQRARIRLAQAKKEQHEQSVRHQAKRERELGRIVWRLIGEGVIDASMIERLRDEVQATCCRPAQVAAFRGTPLGD